MRVGFKIVAIFMKYNVFSKENLMKVKLRYFILSLLTFVPLTSVAYAAAIARGKERNGTLEKSSSEKGQDGKEEDQDTDGNVSDY
jgi:hypothetical protein